MNDEQKIHQVLTWILEGQPEHTIRESIAQHWPDTDARPLIVSALAAISESGKITHAEVQNRCLAYTQFIYQKQIEIGEFAGALAAVKQLYSLSANRENPSDASKNQAKVIEHHHQHQVAIITQENLEEHRRQLVARAARLITVSAVGRGTTSDPGEDRAPRARAKPTTRKPKRSTQRVE